ncbi:MAG: HD domain-containing protein [Candidatus Helarchaeota archaeon]
MRLKGNKKKSVTFSEKFDNFLKRIKKEIYFLKIQNTSELINYIKSISSIYFPDLINFREYEKDELVLDPVYQDDILVKKEFLPIIYSPPFQRLNHIRQLSFAFLEYKGANHTRFDHSLGTYHLIGKVYQNLCLNCDWDYKIEEERELLFSALFHDIGHSPFSHSLEFILYDFQLEDKEIAENIIKKYFQEYIENLDVSSDNIIKNIITSDVSRYDLKQQVFKTLIDGALDTDRVDYIRRDYFYCLGRPPELRYYLSNACYCHNEEKDLYLFALKESSDVRHWLGHLDNYRRYAFKRIYESDFSIYTDEIILHALYYFCKNYINDLQSNYETIKKLVSELVRLPDHFFLSLLFLLGNNVTKDLIIKVQFRQFFKNICKFDLEALRMGDRLNSKFYEDVIIGKKNEIRLIKKIEQYENEVKRECKLKGNFFISIPKKFVPIEERKKLCERKNPDLICIPLAKDFKKPESYKLFASSLKEEERTEPTRRQYIFVFIDDDSKDLSKKTTIINSLCKKIIHNYQDGKFKEIDGIFINP